MRYDESSASGPDEPARRAGGLAGDRQPVQPADGRAGDRRPVEPTGAGADDRPLLPDVTTDERDVGWGDPFEQDDDEHYLREVPPHHGG